MFLCKVTSTVFGSLWGGCDACLLACSVGKECCQDNNQRRKPDSLLVAATKMRAATEADASHPIVTFGKPHTHINWQGNQACAAKVASSLMGDQALFTPQTHSGSGDSTQASSRTWCPKACHPTAQLLSAAIFYLVSGVQEAVSDPVNHRLTTRESHNRQATSPEGQTKDKWTPKVQDWHEADEDYEPSDSERKAVNKVGP